MARFHLIFLLLAIVVTFASYRFYLRKNVVQDHSEQLRTRLEVMSAHLEGTHRKNCKEIQLLEKQSIYFINRQGDVVCPSKFKISKAAREQLKKTDFKFVTFKSSAIGENFIAFRKVPGTKYLVFLKEPLSVAYKLLHSVDISFLSLILPAILGLYLLVLYITMRVSKPIKSVLQKVSDFEDRMSFENKMKFYYHKDEWSKIEMALTEAEDTLKYQLDEIKNEAEKTETLLESISDAILAVDYFHNALFFNSKFNNLFIREEDTIVDRPKLWKIFDQKEVIDAFNTVLKEGKTLNLKGFEFKGQDAVSYFDIALAPLKNNQDEITGAVGVFHDVTEAKLTEKMRVDFVANVSHEIRTPLTSIKGFGQMLQAQKSELNDELQLYLKKIIGNSEKLISLFNDLLNLSVIESTTVLAKHELDLKNLLDSISSNIKSVYQDKSIQVNLDLKVESILADDKLINQVFTNLIDNACKYNDSDPVINISSEMSQDNVTIRVEDNGHGIPEEHLDRVFERFFRVDASRDTKKHKGTGIGLSIVKHIIAKHGGSIKADSRTEGGTIFSITLPNS